MLRAETVRECGVVITVVGDACERHESTDVFDRIDVGGVGSRELVDQ